MPIVKQYLKYEHVDAFGIVSSSKSNVIFLKYKDTVNQYIASGCCEQVCIFNTRTQEKIFSFDDNDSAVILLKQSPNRNYLAVGFDNGSLKIYDLVKMTLKVRLDGHKSAISGILFEEDSLRVMTTSSDCSVVLWDLVEEKGMFKLKGHKSPITGAVMVSSSVLSTCSNDGVMKLWDLNSQHCFRTEMVPNWQNIGGMAHLSTFDYLLAVSRGHGEIKCFGAEGEFLGDIGGGMEDSLAEVVLDDTCSLMACHNGGRRVYLYLLVTSERELRKLVGKRAKKQQQAKRPKVEGGEVVPGVRDIVRKQQTLVTSGKVKCCHITSSLDNLFNLCVGLTCNSVEVYEVSTADGKLGWSHVRSLEGLSHRAIVRAVGMSGDGEVMFSGSWDCVKVWSRACRCRRTIEHKGTTCMVVMPGDRFVLVGDKSGRVALLDCLGERQGEEVEAHSGVIWGVDLAQGGVRVVTASADKTVKFWEVTLGELGLSLSHLRTLDLEDEVLAVRVSPDDKYIVVSLLNNSVKICFLDTFKLLHTLYGHSLPALTVDISSDSRFVITGGADRQIMIWGVDFGDCVRRIHGHSDSITCLRFVPNTHYFFSSSKDGRVRQWNADNYERIMSLERHFGAVWAFQICGDSLLTASSDHSLRLWTRTEEIHLPMEDEEKELEKLNLDYEDDDRVVPGDAQGEAEMAGKVTCDTLSESERLTDAVERFRQEVIRRDSSPDYDLCQWMAAYGVGSAEEYLMEIIGGITPSELDRCLMLLPYSYGMDVISLLVDYIGKSPLRLEFACRCLFYLLRIHHMRMTVDPSVKDLLYKLSGTVGAALEARKSVFGFVTSGVRFMRNLLDKSSEAVEANTHKLGKRRKVNKFVTFLNSYE